MLFGVFLLPVLWPCCVICLAIHELGYIRVKFRVFMSKTIFNLPAGFCAGAGVPRSRNNALFALHYDLRAASTTCHSLSAYFCLLGSYNWSLKNYLMKVKISINYS